MAKEKIANPSLKEQMVKVDSNPLTVTQEFMEDLDLSEMIVVTIPKFNQLDEIKQNALLALFEDDTLAALDMGKDGALLFLESEGEPSFRTALDARLAIHGLLNLSCMVALVNNYERVLE